MGNPLFARTADERIVITDEGRRMIACLATRPAREVVAADPDFHTFTGSRKDVGGVTFCPIGWLVFANDDVTTWQPQERAYILNCTTASMYASYFADRMGLTKELRLNLEHLFVAFMGVIDADDDAETKRSFIHDFFVGVSTEEEAALLGIDTEPAVMEAVV